MDRTPDSTTGDVTSHARQSTNCQEHHQLHNTQPYNQAHKVHRTEHPPIIAPKMNAHRTEFSANYHANTTSSTPAELNFNLMKITYTRIKYLYKLE